jgi:CDP-diacylglycerol---glycerol-3-phosphate 3-phosphatidyltransferase
MATDSNSSTIWNVPNRLSVARLVVSIFLFVFVPLGWYYAAFFAFVLAAGTDWVDGWWARKYNQVTKLGRILDPFCDKILICGAFILLAVEMRDFPWYASITGWMAVLVTGRELLVTGLRSFIEQSGGDFSAKWAGKLKMIFQCFAGGACLYALARSQEAIAAGSEAMNAIPGWLWGTLIVSIWLSVILTIWSGVEYIFIAIKSIDLGSK